MSHYHSNLRAFNRGQESYDNAYDASYDDDSDTCECDLTPTIAEEMSGKCGCCGKPLFNQQESEA